MITKKEFNGNVISFGKRDDSGEIMVNATEMAKPFGHGKEPSYWLATQQAKNMIDAISVSRNLEVADLVRVTNGGNTGNGTWMHEDVALVFAQWLSPDFYIWCNDRIKELLTVGITAKEDVIDMIINDPDMGIALLTKLKEERAKRKEAEGTVAILTHTNKTYTATEIAKELGFKSAIEFNKALAERGIQFKQNNTWVPYADYSQNGWFEIKQEVLDNGHIIYHRMITGLGRKAFNQMFNEIQSMISRDYEVIVYNTLDKSHRMEDKATRRSDAYSLLRSMMNTSRNACRAYPLKYENTSITGKIYLNDELLEAFRVDVFGRKRYTRVSM